MGIHNTSRRARTGRSVLATSLFASTMLAGGAAFAAAPAAESVATVPEVIVTAEKRSENIQKVSMSIQALDSKSLEQRNVNEFQDYVKFLPSVSFQTTAPSSTTVYMRGVASGGDGNHSGSLPSVGTYLDEQPITTISGALDVHIYDIERVESLAGPQGTLYGASSESGTLRIITNKPSTRGFSAGYDLQANGVKNGTLGYVGVGMIPVTSGPIGIA
jgi:iron complex outermembrane recepter protein